MSEVCETCPKMKALEDAYDTLKRVLLVLNRRTALLRQILEEGRLEQSELRKQVEEETR